MTQKRKKLINQGEDGLTVGELTIAIAGCLLLGLVWFTFKGQEESKTSYFIQQMNTESYNLRI